MIDSNSSEIIQNLHPENSKCNANFKKENFQTPHNVSVDTSVRSKQSIDIEFELNFKFFALAEVGVQTDLTGMEIDELWNRKKIQSNEFFTSKKSEPFNINQEGLSLLNQKRKKVISYEEQIKTQETLCECQKSKKVKEEKAKKGKRRKSKKDSTGFDTLNVNKAVNKQTKNTKKKLTGFMMLKRELRQVNKFKNDEEANKECEKEWNKLEKEMKICYNVQAENENKMNKRQQKQKNQQWYYNQNKNSENE